jgi:hypothetical protein
VERRGEGARGYGHDNSNDTNMRDKHYAQKTVRLSEETWEELKIRRAKSKLSWNMFMRGLLDEPNRDAEYAGNGSEG